MRSPWPLLLWMLSGLFCGYSSSHLAQEGTSGQFPLFPAPHRSLIPVIKVAPAIGWPRGTTPVAAEGLAVNAFATALDHPRWIYVLANGDVLLAESAAPPQPEDGLGIKRWFIKRYMQRAGAVAASANRITLLREANHDGIAKQSDLFLDYLNSPIGMVLIGNALPRLSVWPSIRTRYLSCACRKLPRRSSVIVAPGLSVLRPELNRTSPNVITMPRSVCFAASESISERSLSASA